MMLAASLATLALAPVVGIAITRIPEIAERFFALILVLMVLFLALPEAWASSGIWVVPAVLVGLLGPTVAERWATHHTAHVLPLTLICIGFLAHTGLDGAAIGTGHEPLAAAVVLHRLPAAAATWWTVEHGWGRTGAALVMSGAALTTLVGYAFGSGLEHTENDLWMGLIAGVTAGALCHVVLHSPDHDHGHDHAS